MSIVLDIKVVKAPSLEVEKRFPRGNAVLGMHGAYFIAFIIQPWYQNVCSNYQMWPYCVSLYDTVLNRNRYYFYFRIQIVTWAIIFCYVCVYLTNNFSCNLTADFVCKLCKVKRDVYRIFSFKALK